LALTDNLLYNTGLVVLMEDRFLTLARTIILEMGNKKVWQGGARYLKLKTN